MGKPAADITGKRFGKLVVLRRAGRTAGSVVWACRCDCGVEKEVTGSNLRSNTSSCGCNIIPSRTRHGLAKHPLYLTWYNMVRRSGNKEYGKNYEKVTVYGPWKKSVATFVEYVERNLGQKPSRVHSIDRVDNSKGYRPGNIRWADKVTQSVNRSCVRILSINGESGTVKYFSAKYGIRQETVKSRLRRGLSPWEALTTPVRPDFSRLSRTRNRRDRSGKVRAAADHKEE